MMDNSGVTQPPVERQHVRWEIDYDVRLGLSWGRFINGLRERELLANRCAKCGSVFTPPQAFCETCYVEPADWMTMPETGDLVTYTVVEQGFKGGPRPPYAVGAVRIDGSSTMLLHFLGGLNLDDPAHLRDQLPDGKRVRIKWAEERNGSILDIACFVPA